MATHRRTLSAAVAGGPRPPIGGNGPLDDPRPEDPGLPAVDANPGGAPLSVAFVSPGWPPDAFANGVIPYIGKIAGELGRQGHRATILASNVVGHADGVTVRDVRPAGVSSNPLIRKVDQLAYRVSVGLGERRQAVRSVVEECRRLIDEQALQLLEMEEAFGLAYWVREKLPIPVVVRLHGPWFLNGPFLGKVDDAGFRAKVRAEGLAIARADSVTSPSLDVLERTRAHYGLALESALVIPPPTAMVPEARRWRPDVADPNLILFVGRFDLHKGADLIIRAFAEVARRRPDARLRFVGDDRGLAVDDGPRIGIRDYIRREASEFADRIEYLGQRPSSDLDGLRREARVTVVCSRYETFGLTLTEAMTCGCPIVATRAGAFPELMEDGVNGLFCAPEDPADLAEKIGALLDDGALAARLGRRAALDGERRFEAGALARELSGHYRRVIEAAGRSGRGDPPMNYLFCQVALFVWLPVVVGFFVVLPPRKAVVVSYISAWLALPNISFNLPGVPDYTKMTATVVAVMLCMVIFDQRRLLSIRPRWYDLPMVVWCLCPFVSATTNGLGSYEGFSAILEQVVSWGLPYLIGRAYFNDLDGLRDLALGIAIGGLAYVPLCLLEIRFSPVLESMVYGISHWEYTRYGGYRPKVFLSTGLELGMWMTNASLICYQLWSCGTVKTLRGYRLGTLLLALLATTVLCKSTGAIGLLILGLGALWITRKTGRSWALWLMLAIPPFYTVTRTFNLWSGQEAVQLSEAIVGGDRAESLKYRLNMENLLAGRALEQPTFGWGRFNRNQITNKKNQVLTIPDGFWILALGITGLVGLTSLVTMMLQPLVLTIRRFPVATWTDPSVGPVVGLAVLLMLTMIDFLSNAMLNPVYALTMGGVVGQSAARLGGRRREAEASLLDASDLMAVGRAAEAELEFGRAVEFASDGDDLESRRVQAEALDGLGQSLLATGRLEEAELAFRDALVVRDWLAAKAPEPGRYRDLAIAREGLGRALSEVGRTAEAIEERQIALQIWDILAADHPRDDDYRGRRVDALNDLAWLLSTDPDPALRDPARALNLAEEAAGLSGDHLASWNTLGVARYRAGDWAGAIEALERSALSGPDRQGTSFDHFFLAMAWCRLQHEDRAREWLERGIAWASGHRPGHPALARFREEAEALLADEHGRASLGAS